MDGMTALDIALDGERAWDDLETQTVLDGRLVGIARLRHGTAKGQPAVLLRVTLPDGQTVIAQTTMALFLTAAEVFRSAQRPLDPKGMN